MDTGERLTITREPTRDVFTGMPETSPDDIVTVVKVRMREKTDQEKAKRQIIGIDNPEDMLT